MTSSKNAYLDSFARSNIKFWLDEEADLDGLEEELVENGLTEHQATVARRVLYVGMKKEIDWRHLEDYDTDQVIDMIFSKCALKKDIIGEVIEAVGECLDIPEVYELNGCHIDGGTYYHDSRSSKKVVIPRYYCDYGDVVPVTSIGMFAFEGYTSLEEVVIPDTVTKIDDCAFEGCKSLKEIVIPDSVNEIGEYAFEECTSLKKIVIPDSVTKIGWEAFDPVTEVIRRSS